MTKILLVEDDELNRDMLGRRLRRKGFDVIEAIDGHEAISRSREDLPDIVLMDMSLPTLDGWSATQQLKSAPETKDIPIIALTAHAMAGDREKAFSVGCDDYDTKPIEFKRLLGKIEKFIEE